MNPVFGKPKQGGNYELRNPVIRPHSRQLEVVDRHTIGLCGTHGLPANHCAQ